MSWGRYAAVAAVLLGTAAYSQTPTTFVPGQVLTAAEINTAFGSKLDNNSGLWTTTQTFQPASGKGIVVNGLSSAPGTVPAVDITKGLNSGTGVAIRSGDTQGKLLSIFGPASINQNINPPQYFDAGGFHSLLSLTVSGVSSGTGDSFNVTNPTNDAYMIGIFADVAKAAQFRCPFGQTFAGGSAVLSMVGTTPANVASYVGADLCDGTRAFGSKSNTSFAGMDAFLGYGGTATLHVGGFDVPNPVAQSLGSYNVAGPLSNNTQFLAGKVFHFTGGIPAGVNIGDPVVDLTNPAFPAGTVVTAIDRIGNTVTTNNFGNPYQGDVFTFNGVNNSTMTNQLGSTNLAVGNLIDGVVAGIGQLVADTSNPTAIPGATTVTTITPNVFLGFSLITVSNPIDGVLFNTAAGGHDTLTYSIANTAAADMSWTAGQGTGTGAGGKHLFKAAPAGGSGSSQNALVTYITVDPAGAPEVQVAKGLKAGFYASAAPNTQTGATYVVAATDTDIIANRAGTVTLTLPAAASFVGRVIRVKTIQNQTVVSDASNVAPLTSATPGTAILAGTAGKWADLKSDGSNWITMAGN